MEELLRSTAEEGQERTCEEAGARASLPQRLMLLLHSNRVRAQTILAMQQVLERAKDEYNQLGVNGAQEAEELRVQL